MKTVLAAKEKISRVWGSPKPKNTEYRLIKYLLSCNVDDGVLLHNCVTGHLIHLTRDEAEFLKHLPSEPTEFMREMIASHFLVPNDYDEYKSVNQLRSIYQKRYTGDAINHYVILPTTFCNARCFYCYESDYPHIHMTEETARKLIDYIDLHRQGKPVQLSWFGGEPLVGMARIDQVSQGLKDLEIPFEADMVSNGFLFDEETVDKSVRLWNLKRVQITLDGTEEIYNRVKAYSGIKDNPYQRVHRNIKLLTDNSVFVVIRLNVDYYNKDDIRLLIEELGKRYSGNKHVAVYLNMLFTDQGFEPVRHSQDDIIEIMQIIDEYTERLKELGLSRNRRKIPSLEFSQCMADNQHTIEIQPNGGFSRCEHESVRDTYGTLDDGILNPEKLANWRERIERSEHCPECTLYPACYQLRLCMNADKPCIDSRRLNSEKVHKEHMCSIYYKSLEDNGNENV